MALMALQPDISVSWCVFDASKMYRYVLHRGWDASKPRAVFIGLNPSVADETHDDNTVRKCIGYARREGCGSVTMLNAFAFRSTDPKGLKACADPIGSDNNAVIAEQCAGAGLIVVSWGNHGAFNGRHGEVLALLANRRLLCFGTTNSGMPKHPLYLSSKAPLVQFFI